ncbi:MAG: long-chain fatty acid--CoA ligase [Streptosporangiaceae bacterium]|nr:long-chain fatty acid--CoA ligase [Streptosporangiaceae bacterium]
MNTTPVPGDVAAERDAIESEIAGGTLLTAFDETVRTQGDTEAYRWQQDGGWRSLTYAQVREHVRDLALGLAATGFQPGEFAVIWSRNRPEPNIADLAVMHARGVPVFLYNTLAPEQAAYIAGHCEATVAFVENRDVLARLAAVRGQLPRLRRVILIEGEPPEDMPGVLRWEDVLAQGEHQDKGTFGETWQKVGPGDLATLIYTSGTTGRPKGVMITHHNVRYYAAAASRIIPPERIADDDGTRLISYLPMAHATGRSVDHWLPVVRGRATVAFCPDATQLFAVAAQVRPTYLMGVPRVWEKLHAALSQLPPGTPGRDVLALAGLDRCRFATSGAAPLDPAIITFFRDLGLPLTEGWGMTELTNAATLTHPDRFRDGVVGTVFPGVELRLAEDGEVLVRGPLVMRGYYRDPERTAEALDPDGWLRTGDIGKLDADGYLSIVDRKKELIITSGGKNISPAAIEYQLQRHPLIGQACAIGDRRNYVTALLVLDPDTAPAWARARGIEAASLAGLAAHPEVLAEVERGVAEANRHLARVEQVKRFWLLPDEWTAQTGELTPSMKRKRRVIAEHYAAEIDQLYA